MQSFVEKATAPGKCRAGVTDVADDGLRKLERDTLLGLESEERLVHERCRVHGHEAIEFTGGFAREERTPGESRHEYPLKVTACTRCGWVNWRMDVKGRRLVE
jgi:hypothetical protein